MWRLSQIPTRRMRSRRLQEVGDPNPKVLAGFLEGTSDGFSGSDEAFIDTKRIITDPSLLFDRDANVFNESVHRGEEVGRLQSLGVHLHAFVHHHVYAH